MEDLNIWRTYHKEEQILSYSLKNDPPFRLFNNNDLAIVGENINRLNRFYSEMVTMYWVWKNIRANTLVSVITGEFSSRDET